MPAPSQGWDKPSLEDSPFLSARMTTPSSMGEGLRVPGEVPVGSFGADLPASSVRPAKRRDSPGASSATFGTILFSESPDPSPEVDPLVLRDLNLDQVFASLAKGREEYDLVPLFSSPPTLLQTITYRQEVFRDLEREPVRASVEAFAASMRSVRAALGRAHKFHNRLQRARWHLEGAERYCRGVRQLADDLGRARPRSQGLCRLHDYLLVRLRSESFHQLRSETQRVRAQLDEVAYCVLIHGDRVTVSRYSGERDYGSEIEETFGRFPQGTTPDRRFTFHDWDEMNHVEEAIQERVAHLFPQAFGALREYPDRHAEFQDPVLVRFDREVEFYLGFLEMVGRLRSGGLSFCYPEVSDGLKEVEVRETFDLALAEKLRAQRSPVVLNDVRLEGPERIIVVSGPNNGGKTTFARMFGQLHYLARLGCLVPGTAARLFLSDRIFTHFERVERLAEMRGKLMDELVRVHAIVREATDRSVIVLNETFASATVHDALLLGRKVLGEIRDRGALCVYVTFLDELSTLGKETVSVVSTVSPEDPEIRTFKLVRMAADGRAYALAIARKYGLTYENLRSRFGP